MPGVAPIAALALKSLRRWRHFKCGRDFAAWLGLVPRQKSSGGKQRPGKVSKMGQRDIRRLLIIGAMAVVRWASWRRAPDGSWLVRLMLKKPRMLGIHPAGGRGRTHLSRWMAMRF
ncbi:transposase [Mesorhizobium ventifaucium]|uniref:transposase n=1 Tax=Mesorhizobium ventifaucium TaxID=666020 RepID=UPI0020A75AE9|nr:transposase [Mesorhizobium ventifaucium]